MSYLIFKYKDYLINTYNKLKESIINRKEVEYEKFSIVNDIYKFIDQYNSKYQSNINIHRLIQGDEEDTEIIKKVCN